MKTKYIFFSIVAGLTLSSCGDMDFHEYKVVDYDFISNQFGNVYGFSTPVYNDLDYDFGQMYSGASLCSATDEAVYSHQGNQIESFYNGSWGPSNANSNTWGKAWDAIAYCNLFLDKFTGLTFDDYKLDVNYKAEMEKYENYQYEFRFMRAYHYFLLVRQYGGVPLKLTDMDANEANNLPRATADEVFDFIISECDDIKDKIIPDYASAYAELGLNENGRANNLAVLALKARAALYHASPLFTEGKSDSEKKQLWLEAALASQECLNECTKKRGMRLAKDYEKLFASDSYSNAEALKEIIFATRVSASNAFEKYNFPIGMENAGGGNCPTENLVSAYEMTNGKPITDPSSGYDPTNPYKGRDKRLGLTVAVNGELFPNSLGSDGLQIYEGGANSRSVVYGTPTGYYLKKYLQASQIIGATNATTSYHIWVLFRLGSVYLDYAEAALNYFGNGYQTGDGLTMSAAEAINVVRTRAGQPGIATGLSFDEFTARYENERFVELAFEGHRFYDVRRWKKGPEYFTNIKVMEIKKDGDACTYNVVTNPSYITTRQWNDRNYLAPIPQSEIMKAGNLTQNPGW